MITLDPAGPIVPFEQIRAQIADGIRSGALLEGARLPSIRQLASDLRVAAGTVAKAYAALESEGLIESSRARGTRVRAGNAYPAELRQAAEEFVRAAASLSLDQALGAVRTAWPRP